MHTRIALAFAWAIIMLAGSAAAQTGRLEGRWSAFCQPTSPQAFEPMTMNGAWQLQVAGDGAITGTVDGASAKFPIAGKRGAAGTVSGQITMPDGAQMPWKGDVAPAGAGRLKGAGSLGEGDLHPAFTGPNCRDGMWFSR
jgi:hypothetical protein